MSVMSVMSVKLDFSTTKDDLNRLKVLLNSTKQQNGTEPASPNKEANEVAIIETRATQLAEKIEE